MTVWKWQWIWPSRMTIKHVHNNFHQTWSFFWELQLIFLSRSRFSIPNFSQVSLLPVALRLLGKGHPRTGGRQQLGLTVSTKHGDILWRWQHDKMEGGVWIWNQLFFDMLFGFVWKWVYPNSWQFMAEKWWSISACKITKRELEDIVFLLKKHNLRVARWFFSGLVPPKFWRVTSRSWYSWQCSRGKTGFFYTGYEH